MLIISSLKIWCYILFKLIFIILLITPNATFIKRYAIMKVSVYRINSNKRRPQISVALK